jgi:hypothetical protein
MHLRSTVGCQMSTLHCGEGGGQKYFLYAQMSNQCDDCAIRVKYLLLIGRNFCTFCSYFFFLVLRHIALLVACLVVARLSLVYYCCRILQTTVRFISSDCKLWKNILDIHLTQHVELYIVIIQHAEYLTLENTEGAIKNGKSWETGNIWYARRRQTK